MAPTRTSAQQRTETSVLSSPAAEKQPLAPVTNGGALASPADKFVEYIPFHEREAIRLSIGIVRNWLVTPTKSGALPTDSQCMRFIMLCKARQLNPYVGDAYLVGYDSDRDGPQFTLITAHQALLKRAEVHPEYDGMESGVMVRRKGQTLDLEGDYFEDGDIILGAWAAVHFRNRRCPMRDRVKLSVYNTQRSRWKADPAGMIVKVAEASCLRRAFPTTLGGMFLTEHGASFEPSAPERLAPGELRGSGFRSGARQIGQEIPLSEVAEADIADNRKALDAEEARNEHSTKIGAADSQQALSALLEGIAADTRLSMGVVAELSKEVERRRKELEAGQGDAHE